MLTATPYQDFLPLLQAPSAPPTTAPREPATTLHQFVDSNYHMVEVENSGFYSSSFWSTDADHRPTCFHRLTVDLYACVLLQFRHIEKQWEHGDLTDARYHLLLHRIEEIKRVADSAFTQEAIRAALAKHPRFPKPEVEWTDVSH